MNSIGMFFCLFFFLGRGGGNLLFGKVFLLVNKFRTLPQHGFWKVQGNNKRKQSTLGKKPGKHPTSTAGINNSSTQDWVKVILDQFKLQSPFLHSQLSLAGNRKIYCTGESRKSTIATQYLLFVTISKMFHLVANFKLQKVHKI